MAKFFIERPIFAWVVALFIIIAGVLSVRQLPVNQYPSVAPTTITISTAYAGADAQTMEDSVMAVIEREMFGVEGVDYIETKSMSNGTGSMTLTFKPGTNKDIAQVNTQNALARVTPRLPAAVRQVGVQVQQSRANFLMFVMLYSDDPSMPVQDISDYAARNVIPDLQRLEGLGSVQLFGAERAMRIWIDPAKLQGFNLSLSDVNNAIASQNAQIPGGSLGALPNVTGQAMTATVVVPAQLKTVADFENIVLRANAGGSTLRLKDVARVELGSQDYNTRARLNGKPAVGIGIQLSNTGNAIAASKAVQERMAQMQAFFPSGVKWDVPYDSSTFVGISIEKVVHTLLEAIFLVFVVMLLFLQNIRYTLIPTIVVPIALLGTFAVMSVLGMSINVLSMFAMVLVIGIVVDDAIVVVENVERIMAEERLSPLQATRKAMSQISGAVIGITVVLISVFIPMAFFSGSTGNIYRQFSLVMAVSIFFSAFLALSLTPALCATLLKPIEGDPHHKTGLLGGFFNAFNRRFHAVNHRYENTVARLLRRAGRLLVVYVALAAAAVLVMLRLPGAFLPQEDQGYMMVMVQLPSGATQERTLRTIETMEQFTLDQPEVAKMVTIAGFGFGAQGQNVGMGFITLKDWAERAAKGSDAASVAGRVSGAMAQQVRDGFVFALSPPSIPELGALSGFSYRLEDRNSQGYAALLAARNQLLGLAAQSKVLTGVRPEGLEAAPVLRVDIDRDAMNAQGVNFSSLGAVLSGALGSSYVNDFPNQGRMQRVIVQADAVHRMQPEDIGRLTVNNNQGMAVPLSTMVRVSWDSGPMQTLRYNGYPAMSVTGSPQPGYSTGDAMREMERLSAQLPPGFGFEWTGLSREEQQASGQSLVLYGFAILAVFLCLAALYESWSVPLAVILVVPLGFLGVVLGVWGRGLANDVYFQVGLITVIGLSAKNAILIVEFAKDLQATGKSALEAALAAAHLRFRPIIMTSLAFILGVVPLYFASGASSASQRAIGTSVLWGMVIGTLLSVFFVPMFYAVVRTLFKPTPREQERFQEHAAHAGMTPESAERYLAEAEADLTAEERAALHDGNIDIAAALPSVLHKEHRHD